MVPANKAAAGFRILMILSHVDGQFADEEAEVGARYISKHFSEELRLEGEIKFLQTLKQEDYFLHFREYMDFFYRTSSSHERAGLVKFAVEMIKADRKITSEENIYLSELLNSWEPEHTG